MTAFGQPEIQTQRLLLRPLAEADAEALLAIHSDTKVMRYSNSPAWTGIEQAHDLIRQSRGWLSSGRHLCLGIARKDEGVVMGTCTLFDIHRDSRRAELGFVLASPAWGQGYMTEALVAFLNHGFSGLGLNRVEADTDPRNLATIKLLGRLGFVREGLLRERWISSGEKSDTALYGLLESDWTAGSA
ncbi:GNAT family N-acetyltransferase [Ideonella sp. YS5]|uniref:GNAT family N-acetyltransferase n=1 Tax=Ideonella sp. YS5 TaxID=3453714 RepID=UPI003EEB11DE